MLEKIQNLEKTVNSVKSRIAGLEKLKEENLVQLTDEATSSEEEEDEDEEEEKPKPKAKAKPAAPAKKAAPKKKIDVNE